MKKTINKDIKKYCFEVKKLLACPGSIKLAFISELKNRIYEYIEKRPNEEITINDIENRFGTPKDIASSFASAEDIHRLHKKAKRFIFYKILSIVLLLALILTMYILVYVITHDHTVIITNDFKTN